MNHLKEIPNRPREIVYADDSTRRRSNTLGVNPSNSPINVLTEELVLVDWGPMTLTVSAWRKGRARPVIAARAARAALRRLRILADFQGYLARPVSQLPADRSPPRVVARATDAARAVSPDLTPLAAVAGAAADEVAGRAAAMGADRVIVNNGGDIALKLRPHARAVVGLKPMGAAPLLGRLEVTGDSGVGGVASSGWAGRSHSPGVADLVTVWSDHAALADAAATFIAGKTAVAGANIKRARARDLDLFSDLGETSVTREVGPLTSRQRRAALDRGKAAAEKLARQGALLGCMLVVQGDAVLFDPHEMMKRA